MDAPLCKDCRYGPSDDAKTAPLCGHPDAYFQETELVFGLLETRERIFCHAMRYGGIRCGESGAWFEPRTEGFV